MKGNDMKFKTLLVAIMLCGSVFTAQAAEKVRMAVTDIAGLEMLQAEFGKFREVLSEATGYDIEFYPVTSRTAAVEALRAKKIDFVLTGPAEYVVINKLTNAYPVVGFSRPDYFSAVVVMADSGITHPKDLKGKKVAVGDIGSTSNHLAPSQVMADYGLDPMSDVQLSHISRNVAWEALKRGDIAAIGINYGKFLGLREREQNLEPGAFRVIARGPDLPNDLLMAASYVDKDMVENIRKAFTTHKKALVDAILVGDDNQKYLGMKFIPDVKDADYDYVRSMYKTIGQAEFAAFVGE